MVKVNLPYFAGFGSLNMDLIQCSVHEILFFAEVKLNIYKEFLQLFSLKIASFVTDHSGRRLAYGNSVSRTGLYVLAGDAQNPAGWI
jgi:hypothetical protein